MRNSLAAVVALVCTMPAFAGEFADNVDKMLGNAVMAQESFDKALASVTDKNIAGYADACRALVRNYGQLSTHLVDGSVLVGQSHARLEMVQSHLAQLRKSIAQNRQIPDVKDISQLEAEVLVQIQKARDQYRLASDRDKQHFLAEMAWLVNYLDQLRQWQKVIREGAVPIATKTQLTQLQRLHDQMTQQIQLEERLLSVIAHSLSGTLQSVSTEMRRSAQLLAANGSLPREQLQRLQKQRDVLKKCVEDLRAVRHKIQSSQQAQLRSVPIPSDPSKVLDRVKDLLD